MTYFDSVEMTARATLKSVYKQCTAQCIAFIYGSLEQTRQQHARLQNSTAQLLNRVHFER